MHTAPSPLRAAPHALLGCVALGLVMANAVVAPAWVAVAAVAGATAAAIGRRPGTTLIALGVALSAAGWMWGTGRIHATAPSPGAVQRLDATAEVVAAPRRRPSGGWRVQVRVAGGPSDGLGVVVWLRGDPPPPGARVRVHGTVRPAAAPGDPAWWVRYLEREGMSASMWTARLPVVGSRGGVAGARDRASAWVRDRIGGDVAGDRGALVQGMVLGGSRGLDPEAERWMRDSGLAHLLAVSGQNVAVVAVVGATLLRLAGAPRPWAAAPVMAAVLGYCLLCEPGASVWRAGVVAVAAVLAESCARARDRWYLLLFALTGLLAWQPRSVWDPGLQLSFAAVVGILALGPALRRAGRGWMPGWLADLAGISAAASLATAPVTVLVFGRLATVGPLANVVAVPVATGVLLTGLAGAVAAPLLPPLGAVLLWVAGTGAGVVLLVARAASSVPGAAMDIPGWGAPLTALPAAAVWMASEGRSRHVVRGAAYHRSG